MNELEVLKKKYKDTAIIDIPSLHRVIIVPGVSFPQDYVAAAAELAALSARVAELEAYIRDAKDWFDRFGEHAPIVMGGEGELSNRAAALLKKE